MKITQRVSVRANQSTYILLLHVTGYIEIIVSKFIFLNFWITFVIFNSK